VEYSSDTHPYQQLTSAIIGAAIEVHRNLGPRLLESVYELCLFDELLQRDITVQKQVSLPIQYKQRRIDGGLRLDLVVDDAVIVELKTVENLLPIHEAQLLTYLRLAHVPVGLLLNFNVTRMRDGIKRLALTQ